MKAEIKTPERILSEHLGVHDVGVYVLKTTAIRAMKELEKQLNKKK